MSRRAVFEREEIEGIRGLAALTEPSADEPVGAVVDVAVIGARGDGKTQFIVHAIRTLRAFAPDLAGAELDFNRDILRVVLSAREPRPDATVPGVVPHYVFRIAPDTLLSQIGAGRQLGLLARTAGLIGLMLLSVVNAGALLAALFLLRGELDPVALGAAGAVLLVGLCLSVVIARRRLIGAGDIEIVFWDVAGEHIYKDSAVDYYAFLAALVRERRQRASNARSYAFAPVLICNPLALGCAREGSPFARLRQLIPLFATLGGRNPQAMVAINRWSVVEKICEPDSDRSEVVALAASRRRLDEDKSSAPGGDTDPAEPLPITVRDVVRGHCLDAEDGRDDEVAFSHVRYDAGIEVELSMEPWDGYSALPESVRARWAAPDDGDPDRLLRYIYEEGPGSFAGSARRDFLGWLAGMSYRRARAGALPVEDQIGEGRTEGARDGGGQPGEAGSSEPVAAWMPTGRAASETLEGLSRAIASAPSEPDRDGDRIWSGPAQDDPFASEGTDPGLGPEALVTPRDGGRGFGSGGT